jgi:hypothetical protein
MHESKELKVFRKQLNSYCDYIQKIISKSFRLFLFGIILFLTFTTMNTYKERKEKLCIAFSLFFALPFLMQGKE